MKATVGARHNALVHHPNRCSSKCCCRDGTGLNERYPPPAVHMVVLSGSISEEVIQRGPPTYSRYTCPCLTTHRRSRQHSDRQQNHGVDQATPPLPPQLPLSAQISATTKRGCRLWAGSPWGPGNRGADLLLPLPPPQQKWGRTGNRPGTPPPQHALTPSLQADTW